MRQISDEQIVELLTLIKCRKYIEVSKLLNDLEEIKENGE